MRSLTEIEADLLRVCAGLARYHPRPKQSRDVNAEHRASLSLLERAALWVTDHVGTMGFFLIILAWTVVWLGWNMTAPDEFRFDPYPAFVLWLFLSNLIQIHLMPLIMVGQNLQGRHAELRAQADFLINQRAEAEVEDILQRLDQQAQLLAHQNELLLQILRRLEAPAEPRTSR